MRGRRRPLFGALTCLLLSLPISLSSAQDAPILVFQGSGARDVFAAPTGDRLFVALYSSDDVVALDVVTGKELARAHVGKGPSALLASGDTIAVLNRADSTVSIVNETDMSFRALVPVSPGTNSIVNAGPGRALAIDPFESTLTLIDLANGLVLHSARLTGTLPVSAALAGSDLIVASHTPGTLIRLDATTLAETARVALEGAPRAIAVCGDGCVAVATDRATLLVDVTTMQIVKEEPIPLTGLTAAPSGFVGIEDGMIRGFDRDLNPVYAAPAPRGTRGATVANGDVVAWSPELGRIWRVAAGAAMPGLPIEEAQVPVVAAAEIAPTEPVPADLPQRVLKPVTIAATVTGDAAEPEPDSINPAETPTVEAIPYHLTVPPSRKRLGSSRPYAPRFGDPTGRRFNQELDRALSVATDSESLTQIDFGEPIQNLKGGFRRSTQNGAQIFESGPDTEFDIDNVHVEADSLRFVDKPQELVLNGDVELQRGESTLTADRIRAFNVRPVTITGKPLVPSNREKSIRHPLVPRGYKPPGPGSGPPLGIVEMTNLDWIEPDRALEAETLVANSLTRTAEIAHPHGQTGPVYFGAENLKVLGPDEITASDFWITTCDEPVPHYRLRLARVEMEGEEAIKGSHARLQLGRTNTPFYVPQLTASLLPGERRLRTELDVGRAADIGNFLNVAQWLRLSDNVDLAPRLYVTTQQGTGFGFDSEYYFMNDPASALYRSQGSIRTLYTTDDSGYTHWYHRQEFAPDTVMVGQWEQWYDENFYKDFYNDEYENRTGPRTFASVTRTRPEWLLTGTVAKATNDFTTETEKLPELSFNLLERKLADGFYGTFDTVGGFYETQPDTIDTFREVTIGRLSYDWNVARGFNVLPFVEMDATYYAKTLDDEGDAMRGSVTMGVTAQARLQRSFPGIGNFTGFKHLIIPSATLMYRPDTTLDAEDTPRFDDYDDRPGRFRLESTIDNILLGRNGPTGEVWPVARLTLYQGNDFENEAVRSNDYELELELRPRPTWGLQAVGEVHDLDEDDDDDLPGDDFNRVLAYLFYDDKLSKNSLNGRLGFAFTESGNDVLNQEVLYGMGYRLTGKWSVAFEQRYDFERNELTRQTYSVRRKFHDWEVGLSVRDKETGVDIGIEINLVDFPEIGLGL